MQYFLPTTITEFDTWMRSYFVRFFIFLYVSAMEILHFLLRSRADLGDSINDSKIFLECLSPRILKRSSAVGSSSIVFPLTINFMLIINYPASGVALFVKYTFKALK